MVAHTASPAAHFSTNDLPAKPLKWRLTNISLGVSTVDMVSPEDAPFASIYAENSDRKAREKRRFKDSKSMIVI
jgi:hypothetical protein